MEKPPIVDQWKRISILGSGAFGTVYLWKHTVTEEYTAIKICKFQSPTRLTEKQRQRWQTEVQTMKAITHANIVRSKPLAPILEKFLQDYNPTRLPLLSMEYCTKGNLRHVLTHAQNSSGLAESEVRVVLSDIVQGVAHLHQNRITHRDLKPENVVLQQDDRRPGGVIYKIIDLGYAKELNDSIVSFVGTLHYLAPEIMMAQVYDCSVDYWSLGILTFEVICGVLPFLPLLTPFERFQFIGKKKSEHICIYQLHSGSVSHSTEILKENHISTCLKQNLEHWLRRALEFTPDRRSSKFPDGLDIFDELLHILTKKIVTVFSVQTLEFYSYEINDSTLVSTLKDWICRDTKVPLDEQVLLTEHEISNVENSKCVADILSKDENTVFVFKRGAFINRDTFTLPKYVQILFETSGKSYKWKDLRVLYTKSLFYLKQEDKLIRHLKKSFLANLRHVKRLTGSLQIEYKDLIYQNLSKVILKVECYSNVNVRVAQSDGYLNCLLDYKRLMAALERGISSYNKLGRKIEILTRRRLMLDQLFCDKIEPIMEACDISQLVMDAGDLISKGTDQQVNLNSREMSKIVSDAIKTKDKLFNNKQFRNFAKATSVAVKDVEDLLTWMTDFNRFINELADAIDSNQRTKSDILSSLVTSPDFCSLPLLTNGFYKDPSDITAPVVIRENQNARCEFEDALSGLLVSLKMQGEA